MNDLQKIIIKEIQEKGSISFRDFMETALYYPGLGYYVSLRKKIGADGDYLTSPAITPFFGKIISRQLTEMWELLGRKKFTIVEYGAGSGSLCYDILENLQNNKRFYEMLSYIIIDKNPELCDRLKIILPDKAERAENGKHLSGISGCILSNELLDNFPIHVVEMQDSLMEVHIGYNNGFYEILKPSSPELINYLQEQKIVLPRGFRTEVNLQIIEWLQEIAVILKEGFVMTMDYGYTSDEISSRGNKNGSVVCYYKHQVNYDPFINIGEQDITAHVNFSALKLCGIKHNLYCSGYTTQSRFLRSLGAIQTLRKMESAEKPDMKNIQNLMTILFSLGEKIKLMVQQKGMDKVSLTGMQFQLPV